MLDAITSQFGPNLERMTPESARFVLAEFFKTFNAGLSLAGTSPPLEVIVITLPLDTAQSVTDPKALGFAFSSVLVRDGSDNNCAVYLRPYSKDSLQDSIKLRKNTLFETGAIPADKAFLHWDAQPGKSVTLEFHVRGKVTNGNQQTISTTSEGTSTTSLAKKTVGTSNGILLPADADRIVTTVQNQGSVPIWVGDSLCTVGADVGGATPGICVLAGQTMYWKNVGALYAIAVSANSSIAVLDEK